MEPPKAVTSLGEYFHLDLTALKGSMMNLPEYVRICQLSDVPTGSMVPFDIGGNRIMIVNVEGVLYAVDRICTHETADLATGFLIDSEVTCPLHLSRFDVANGTVKNPPATKPLNTYKLKVEGTSVYLQT